MNARSIIIIAWRNLWRTQKRTTITLTINALGVMAILVFAGFALYTFESLKEQSARTTGHILLGKQGSFTETEEVPLQYGISHSQQLSAQIRNKEGIRYVLPTISFSGLISNGQKSLVFIGQGLKPKEFRAKGPFLSIEEGALLAIDVNSTDMPQVLLGKGVMV